MEGDMKFIVLMLFLVIVIIIGGCKGVPQRGNSSADRDFHKLYPCAEAAQNKRASVSSKCCHQVKKMSTTCLCALLLSDAAKTAGVKPEAAITIPERCKIAKRPLGYKCGAYSLPRRLAN